MSHVAHYKLSSMLDEPVIVRYPTVVDWYNVKMTHDG